MKLETAEIVKRQALAAIKSLHDLFALCPQIELVEIRKPIGIIIGKLDVDVLSIIYRQYPNLDDLRDTPES